MCISILKRSQSRASTVKYDLAIVGGGSSGGGVAREAAVRGLRVAGFEKDGVGSGRASRSTRLVHGGLRYLAHYDFALVREALQERAALLKIAPHLVRPVPFLMPVYRRRGHSRPLLWTGLVLYDFLKVRRGMPHHRFLPANACLRLEPTLKPEGLKGGFLFYDGQCLFPERLCLENVLDAADHDARVENHTKVVALERNGKTVHGVRIHHELTGDERDVEARLVLNCAGPWLDEIEKLWDPDRPAQLRRTKGIHLVVPRFNQHALIFETQDNRVVFAIPWGDYTLIGTTDTDYEGANEDVRAEAEDVDYLIGEIERVLDKKLDRKDVLFTTAGLRPLPREVGIAASEITRRHAILDHEKENGMVGYATVVGGKITTYRAIADEVVSFAVRKLRFAPTPCMTNLHRLPGGRIEGRWVPFLQGVLDEAQRLRIPADVARHLADTYGAEAMGLLSVMHHRAELRTRIDPEGPWVYAQVDHAVVHEKARTLTDVMLRRLSIGLSKGQGKGVARNVADAMRHYVPWEAKRVTREVQGYLETLHRNWPASPA